MEIEKLVTQKLKKYKNTHEKQDLIRELTANLEDEYEYLSKEYNKNELIIIFTEKIELLDVSFLKVKKTESLKKPKNLVMVGLAIVVGLFIVYFPTNVKTLNKAPELVANDFDYSENNNWTKTINISFLVDNEALLNFPALNENGYSLGEKIPLTINYEANLYYDIKGNYSSCNVTILENGLTPTWLEDDNFWSAQPTPLIKNSIFDTQKQNEIAESCSLLMQGYKPNEIKVYMNDDLKGQDSSDLGKE